MRDLSPRFISICVAKKIRSLVNQGYKNIDQNEKNFYSRKSFYGPVLITSSGEDEAKFTIYGYTFYY